MAAVVRGLLNSGLAERYTLSSITSHRPGSGASRVAVAVSGGLRLVLWAARHPEGLVHIHAAVRGSLYRKALLLLLARTLRRPVLLHVHAGPGDIRAFADGLSPRRRRLLSRALRRAQMIVSVSAASSRAFASAFALDTVGVIPNAAPPAPPDTPPPDPSSALFLGGFEDPAKGGSDLLAAIPALLRAAPTLTISLAGPGDPPPELADVHSPRVCWRGWLDSAAVHDALSAAGIVLLPSRSEGLPMALLEAMAHGRAVVATRVGGVPDLIVHGISGLLIDAGDSDALVRTVSQLASDEATVRRLGAGAREAVADLQEPHVIEVIDSVYRAILSR
jgi:glycosyltransferase involved in cell wall biosynthesis